MCTTTLPGDYADLNPPGRRQSQPSLYSSLAGRPSREPKGVRALLAAFLSSGWC